MKVFQSRVILLLSATLSFYLKAEPQVFVTTEEVISEEVTADSPVFPTVQLWDCVNTVEGTYQRAEHLVSRFPEYANLEDIGPSLNKQIDSNQGYEIKVLHLGKGQLSGEKSCNAPQVVINGGLHANEIYTSQTLIQLAEELLDGYQSNARYRMILDHYRVALILISNPDGKHITDTAENAFLAPRKNNRQNVEEGCDISIEHAGVDLNRNFDYAWVNASIFDDVSKYGYATSNECRTQYPGPYAASEPETLALQNFLNRTLTPTQNPYGASTRNLYMDVHDWGELIIYPFQTADDRPASDQLVTLSKKLAGQSGYDARGSVNVGGISTSYVYGALQTPAVTVEMGTERFASCDTFTQIDYPKVRDVLLYGILVSGAPFHLNRGLDIHDLNISADHKLTATVFNSAYPEKVYTEVKIEYFIDAHPQFDYAIPHEAIILDSDESNGTLIEAPLGSLGLESGVHDVYIRAKTEYTTGVVDAIQLEVP